MEKTTQLYEGKAKKVYATDVKAMRPHSTGKKREP